MPLPEFDNRPGPGEPLFDNSKGSGWDDIKFPLLAVGLPILIVVFFGTAILEFVNGILAALR